MFFTPSPLVSIRLTLRPTHIPGHRTLPEGRPLLGNRLIVTVLDGALAMVPEPREDLALPPVGEFVFVLDPPCGGTDVFQGRFKFPFRVILFIQDRVAVHLLHEVVVGLERFGDLTVSVDPDRKAIDMSDRPVVMGLHHHIRVVALGEGLYRLGDGVGVALVKETAVPVVRVDDRPVVGVGDLTLSEPGALSQKSSTSLGVLDAAWLFQMRRLSPHAVVGYGHRVMRRRALDGVAMAACIARRLDHRLGRDARRPPATRFVQLCTGLLFARGRRTVTSWLRGCGMGRDYKRYYYLLGSVGRKTPAIARALLRILLKRLPGDGAGTPLVFAIDDSPTKRYGPHVEGAGKHHNPTPGPAGSKFLYGHVWVCLARLVRHPLWGAIALPIVSHLYIRAKDVGWMAAYYGWQFHTKLELAAAQIEWLVQQLGPNRPPIWVVTDGAYAKRPFLKRVLAAGVTVISRLRCDAALWSLPVVVDPGQKRGRGRPPKYGKNRIDLAKRAAQTRGWQTGLFSLYGRLVVKKYKTFLATYKPVGGVIRVVLVREPDRWVAYFSTDPDLSVASILETVADRSALEQVFHDVKEVHGAGQQQLRHVWANVGAWNLIGWWHTLVELWAWDRPQSRLRDRSDSPWDKPERRPSHANRCQELRREALQEEYSSLPSVAGLRPKIRRFIQRHAPGRMRLTVLGKCRSRLQGQMPSSGIIWHGKECRTTRGAPKRRSAKNRTFASRSEGGGQCPVATEIDAERPLPGLRVPTAVPRPSGSGG